GISRFSLRESTILVRLGSGLPIESKVLRPIMTVLPVVCALKNLRSSGRCQGSALLSPMVRFSDMAKIKETIGFDIKFDSQVVKKRPKCSKIKVRALNIKREPLY